MKKDINRPDQSITIFLYVKICFKIFIDKEKKYIFWDSKNSKNILFGWFVDFEFDICYLMLKY